MKSNKNMNHVARSDQKNEKQSTYQISPEFRIKYLLYLCVAAMAGCAVPFVRDLAALRESQVENKPEGYELGHPKFFLASVAMAIVCAIMRRVFSKGMLPFYLRNLSPDVPEELRVARAKRGAELVYQTVYFTVASIVGYMIVKDQPYFPALLGGTSKEMIFF